MLNATALSSEKLLPLSRAQVGRVTPLLDCLHSNNIIGIAMSDMVDTCGYDSVDDAILYLQAKIVSMDERRQKAEDHNNESV